MNSKVKTSSESSNIVFWEYIVIFKKISGAWCLRDPDRFNRKGKIDTLLKYFEKYDITSKTTEILRKNIQR
jgi:hypothetical protein